MKNKNIFKKIIFHVDVNSAYLSWEAVYRLDKGSKIDLRKIPSIVGGDPKHRRGVVLAKSIPAKTFGIKTGEPVFSALRKCAYIKIVPPNHSLYSFYSNKMMDILKEYTCLIEKFSIDECFMEFNNISYNEVLKKANKIRNHIKSKLGFTVNIGISTNKLLAKMASDFKKPDKVHTLFKEEIKYKMWNLKIENLFMVGKATVPKLHKLNIYTIGDLANYDLEIIREKFKKHGVLIWNYANGIENSKLNANRKINVKSISNSVTTPKDIYTKKEAYTILNSIAENVTSKLLKGKYFCQTISVTIKNNNFINYSKQKKLDNPTNSINDILKVTYKLFQESWKKEPIRLLGITLSNLSKDRVYQISLFEDKDTKKSIKIQEVIENINSKYGDKFITRAEELLKNNVKD
ncbi:DNA polymerase IV [Clostridium acetireducens DSM 10703]|uniref:DNA polymerase IV n=1 Tax=Clostridium acetireducens DSM 10703 TaxID=1121290 RepID=A0A1E8F0R2_9CLOT|nr:DNA polymerase IV [Clostridium acetireducens]OFI06726.1 DNA polymerase IV [Clostridium acetireducens DSM 10703]